MVRALVDLADGLVTTYDVDDVLDRLTGHCVELVAATAAGVLLVDDRGRLRVRAASADLRAVELLAVHDLEGPCVECVRTGEPVAVPDLAAARHRWPAWAARALDDGFRNVHVVPMRLRDQTIGALTIVGTTTSGLTDADLTAVRAFADIATITLLTHDSDRHAIRNEQLQAALGARLVVEQAKGVLAAVAGLTIEEASALLHDAALATDTHVADLAYEIASGQVGTDALVESAANGRCPGGDPAAPDARPSVGA